MKSSFKNRFKALVEAEITNDLAAEIESNLDSPDGGVAAPTTKSAQAFADSLDTEASPEDYIVNPETDKQLQDQISQRNAEVASVIEGWCKKIEDFVEFLNGTSEHSLQSILSNAQAGTLLAKMQAANSRKLSASAQELASLAESLKSFSSIKAIS